MSDKLYLLSPVITLLEKENEDNLWGRGEERGKEKGGGCQNNV